MAKQVIEGQRKDKLKHIKVSDILVEDRSRVNLGDLNELIESIKANGIIQPITVSGSLRLLAGGRRTAAALAIGLETIPAIIREDSNEINQYEIELFENIHRKDFEWPERARLVEKIDTYYRERDPNWSSRKTATLLDKSVGGISEQIQLARAMEIMPELGEQKNQYDAFKLLKKVEDNAIVAELRRRQTQRVEDGDSQASGTAASAAPGGFDKGLRDALRLAENNYHVGDTFAGMASLRDGGSVDFIECDPPYGIELNENKGSKDSVVSNVRSYEEVGRDDYPSFLARLAGELYRIANRNCWLVFWYGPTWHQQVLTSLREAGWAVDEIPSIWVKKQGQTLQPEKYFARCYEPFFLCRKGNPVMVERGRSNVFEFAGVPGQKKYHPTERPVPLIEELLKTLTAGQTTVFIPFLGSGATLRAVYNMGLKGFGFDLNGEYKDKFMLAVEEDSRRNLTNNE